MPLYEYACDHCSYRTEERESFSDSDPGPIECSIAQGFFTARRARNEGEDEQSYADRVWALLQDESCPGKVTRQLGSPILNFRGGGWAKDSYASRK